MTSRNHHLHRRAAISLFSSLLLALFGTVCASQPGPNNAITDVPGVKVGSYTNLDALTGTTVVLVEDGAVGGVDVRGSAPGTRETDLLEPTNLVEEVQAIVLSGGSAYGLEAATGVVRYLEERGIGYPVGDDRVVPIVPAAILFDLGRGGDWTVRPDASYGYRAAESAKRGPVAQGNVGAGAGAVAGEVKGGLGTASIRLDGGLVVGALVALNPAGSPYNPETGELYGSFLELGGEFGNLQSPESLGYQGNPYDALAQLGKRATPAQNTTLGVIATNARLTKAQAQKVAQMAHDGFARAIRPVHTMFDGDVIFTVATGEVELEDVGVLSALGAAGADAMARAIVHATLEARSVGDYRSYCDTFAGACAR